MKSELKIIKNLIWALKEISSFKLAYIVFMAINSIIKGIVPVISLLIIQHIIEILQYRTGNISDIIRLLFAMVFFQLVCEILSNIAELKLSNYELEFEVYFQEKMLKKVSILSSKDFENSKTYDLINRTEYDANAGILGSIKTMFLLISFLISTVSYIVIVINYNILLFFSVIVLPIIRYLFEKKYNLLEYNVEKKNTESYRKISYIFFLLTNSEYYKEIKMFNLFDFFINKFTKIKNKSNLKLIKLHTKRTTTYSFLNIFENIIDFFITLIIVFETFKGNISIGLFILLNNSIDNLKINIVSMFSQLSFLYKNSAMIEQIICFFELPNEDVHIDGEIVEEIKTIVLKNVSYKYQGESEYALKNINLELKKGESIAFMGYNGSGKSTLVKIIMGIYCDYEGDIYINDINIKEINLNIYRGKISALFQEYIKFESSIKENIKYGNLNLDDNYRVEELLNKLGIRNIKGKAFKNLGYQFSGGTQISVGQWQKLALGRSLYKNADVYIFDEPNASLDLNTERVVWNTIYNEMKAKITIMIIHRFNKMVMQTDRIIVLHKGKIIESGTHFELLKKKGEYSKLYYMQRRNKMY